MLPSKLRGEGGGFSVCRLDVWRPGQCVFVRRSTADPPLSPYFPRLPLVGASAALCCAACVVRGAPPCAALRAAPRVVRGAGPLARRAGRGGPVGAGRPTPGPRAADRAEGRPELRGLRAGHGRALAADRTARRALRLAPWEGQPPTDPRVDPAAASRTGPAAAGGDHLVIPVWMITMKRC